MTLLTHAEFILKYKRKIDEISNTNIASFEMVFTYCKRACCGHFSSMMPAALGTEKSDIKQIWAARDMIRLTCFEHLSKLVLFLLRGWTKLEAYSATWCLYIGFRSLLNLSVCAR